MPPASLQGSRSIHDIRVAAVVGDGRANSPVGVGRRRRFLGDEVERIAKDDHGRRRNDERERSRGRWLFIGNESQSMIEQGEGMKNSPRNQSSNKQAIEDCRSEWFVASRSLFARDDNLQKNALTACALLNVLQDPLDESFPKQITATLASCIFSGHINYTARP